MGSLFGAARPDNSDHSLVAEAGTNQAVVGDIQEERSPF